MGVGPSRFCSCSRGCQVSSHRLWVVSACWSIFWRDCRFSSALPLCLRLTFCRDPVYVWGGVHISLWTPGFSLLLKVGRGVLAGGRLCLYSCRFVDFGALFSLLACHLSSSCYPAKDKITDKPLLSSSVVLIFWNLCVLSSLNSFSSCIWMNEWMNVYVVGTCVSQPTCSGQKTICGSHLFTSTRCVLGIKYRSSGLVADKHLYLPNHLYGPSSSFYNCEAEGWAQAFLLHLTKPWGYISHSVSDS